MGASRPCVRRVRDSNPRRTCALSPAFEAGALPLGQPSEAEGVGVEPTRRDIDDHRLATGCLASRPSLQGCEMRMIVDFVSWPKHTVGRIAAMVQRTGCPRAAVPRARFVILDQGERPIDDRADAILRARFSLA